MNTFQKKYVSERISIITSCAMLILSVIILLVLLKEKIGNVFETTPFNLMKNGDTDAGVLKFLSRVCFYLGGIVIFRLINKRLCFYSLVPIPFVTLAVMIYFGLFYPYGRHRDVLALLFLVIPTTIWLFFLFRQKAHRAPIQKIVAIPICVLGAMPVLLILLVLILITLRAVGVNIYF
ncbi:hypothetical protein [Sinomicrobium pectinilyticum]|uniref:Uncharacterized protein n=1 Tax=Sinomicrobium pectinilyticum TaxID=1084421 RepID=A0A3N0DQV9_SINP1|nr:hypothetical protein [Sinomicrobium pectinilyticum]RNL78034.1 hypothetical protein ED312_20005 [Sinomicrobium pectinilyticum]